MVEITTNQNLTNEEAYHLITAQQQTLKQSAKEAFQNYFMKLGGEATNNIYQIILGEVEKPLLEAIMRYTRGNQSKSAVMLGLSRGTLRKKLKIYGYLK